MEQKFWRQGDVLIVKIKDAPYADGTLKEKDNVLVRGEITGHSHRVVSADGNAKVYTTAAGAQMIMVEREAQVVHEEHDTITLPAGAYRVERQREYSPTANRTVYD